MRGVVLFLSLGLVVGLSFTNGSAQEPMEMENNWLGHEVPGSSGSTGYIGIFADNMGASCNIMPPPFTVVQVYLVHVGSAGVTAAQFSAPKPACFNATYLADNIVFPASIGNTQTGIAIAYGSCKTGDFLVGSMQFFSQETSPNCCAYPILGDPRFSPPELAFVDCGFNVVPGVVQAGVINGNASCPCQSSWVWESREVDHPSGRFDHGIAYDAERGYVLIFGGIDIYPGTCFNDTWQWNGTAWTQLSPAHQPSPRFGNQMAYDSARGKVVLFGGARDESIFGDTWEWDGVDWIEKLPEHVPPARFAHAMTYDVNRARVVMFGGEGVEANLNDTWEWDGADWVQKDPANSPSPRYFVSGNGLAFDGGRGVAVLFGGVNGAFLGDTWEWDGTNWIEKSPVVSPSPRGGHSLAYVPWGCVILFGGNNNSTFQNDTWKWDGTNWTQVFPVNSPITRHRHAMVYDAARNRVVLFGGWHSFSDSGLDDTWELLGPPKVTVVSPNGGEQWAPDSQHEIRWVATDNDGVATIDISYSTDGGLTYPHVIATNEPNDSLFLWTVPATLSRSCRVRVTARDNLMNTGYDDTDGLFSILTLTSIVGHWTFNEASGDTIHDVSGNGNHGVRYNGATWDAGCTSGAMRFHGDDDYVIVPHSPSLAISAGTIEIIFRPAGGFSAGDPGEELLQKDVTGFSDGDLRILLAGNTGLLGVAAEDASTGYEIVSDPNTTPWRDWWHHVAYVFDGTGMKTYVNKVLQTDQKPFPANWINNTRDLVFGYGLATTENPFDGLIDEIRITGAVLSPDEFIYNGCIDTTFTLTTNVVGNGSVMPDDSTCAGGTRVIVEAMPGKGWVFDGWSGGLTGLENPDTIVMVCDTTVTATFRPDSFTVTVTTDPPGLEVVVDSVAYTAPKSFTWEFDESHDVCVDSIQVVGDTVHVFSSWSDGGARCHTIDVSDSDLTCLATFGTTYYKFASIDSIVDIPNDQGGWARVHLTRSWYDSATEEQYPIATYNVWRRVDDLAMAKSITSDGERLEPKAIADLDATVIENSELLVQLPMVKWEGRYFCAGVGNLLLANFPPGTWEIVGSSAAAQREHYIYASPTLGDSSDAGIRYTAFAISAHTTTPSVWFMSPPDSGYSVDNIAPGVPSGFEVAYQTGSGNHLIWDASPDPDFQYFRVYRGTSLDFVPAPENRVAATAGTEWTDPEYDTGGVYYKLTAVDHAGNESDAASFEPATGVGREVIPKVFALYQNVPNPFNPETMIRYDVPAGGGKVMLRVYDVSGRLVRTLVDNVECPGQKIVRWDGTNGKGEHSASGVYFYRMTGPGYVQTRKMILLQ